MCLDNVEKANDDVPLGAYSKCAESINSQRPVSCLCCSEIMIVSHQHTVAACADSGDNILLCCCFAYNDILPKLPVTIASKLSNRQQQK